VCVAVCVAVWVKSRSNIIACIERIENGRQQEAFAMQEKNVVRDTRKQMPELTKKRLVRLLFNHATKHSATHDIIGNNAAGCIPLFAGFTTGALYVGSTYLAANLFSQTYMYIYISVCCFGLYVSFFVNRSTTGVL